VGIEHGTNFLRVQVKSTTARSGAGYRCQFKPNHQKKHDYSLKEIDLFAAYVIPEDTWWSYCWASADASWPYSAP
jgi:hypothetical protein